MNQPRPQADTTTARVLIVDDDADFLASISDLLETEGGFSVDTAADSESALRSARELPPDIALLDVNLGVTSGLDLIPRLKASLPGVPCIVITAYRDVESAVKAVRCGADDYLHKPIEPTALVRTLERHLERRRWERERVEHERRFQAVFDQAFQWLFLLDAEGKVLEVNETAGAFRPGRSRSAFEGMIWLGPWWHSSSVVQEQLEKAVAEARRGELRRFEASIKRPDRDPIALDLSLKPVLDGEGEVTNILVEGRDITDRKRAEEALREAHAGLEKRIRRRTADLERARDEAQNASRAKSDFLSRMSHELRTPLTTIIGWGELLKVKADKSESTEASTGAERILTAAVHLLDLINEILDLATIEAGRIQLEMERIELRGPVKDSLFLISPLAEKRNLEIEDRLSTCDTCLVVGDRRRLKQVFINLLSNAVKYNEDGGKILLSYEELEENRIRIMISNTGAGIPESERRRIFEPFEQLETTSRSEGTGIGLAVTKQLIELMNGAVGVQDSPEWANTFWFELDCEQVSDISAANGEGAQPHIHEQTLLYIEDDPSTLELMAVIVSQIPGWRIVTMKTGRDGLEYARENPPDFVLVDINLPDMNGFEILEKLKRRKKTRDIPVAAISASAMQEQVKKGKEAGFESYLTKPFEVDSIRKLLERFSTKTRTSTD